MVRAFPKDIKITGEEGIKTDENFDFETAKQPTEWCDCDHPNIVAKVKELTDSIDDDEEKAKKIFYFVRDEIPYQVHHPHKKASEVLVQGFGFCATKCLLMSALHRAAGFPTRYRWEPLNRKGQIGFFTKMQHIHSIIKGYSVWFHTNCEVYIKGRWQTSDGLLDKPLYEGLLLAGKYTREQIPLERTEWPQPCEMLEAISLGDFGFLYDSDELAIQSIRDFKPVWFNKRVTWKILENYHYGLRKLYWDQQKAEGK